MSAGGKAAARSIRLLLLIGMVAALPLTGGWITLYVLGGITLLAGFGCCLCSCCLSDCGPCTDCDCDCDPGCGDCDCDCDPGCGDCCDDGGGGGGSGSSSGGGGSGGGGDCGCVEMAPPELAPAAAALPLLVPLSRRLPAHWLSHHPHTSEFDADVYRVAGLRLCIGCFTVYPWFLAASAVLVLGQLAGAWWAWLAAGLALASFQGFSAAGLARRCWHKATIKTLLGLGLAAAVHGVLASPWPVPGQQAALLGLLALALASTIPRTLRMRRAHTD